MIYKIEELCEELNKILIRDGSTEITKSITALYVTRLHPHYAKELLNLNKKIIIKYVWGGKFIGLLTALTVIAGKLILTLLRSTTQKYKIRANINSPIDYLIISHLVSLENSQCNNDFYFGNIEQELLVKNKKVVKILINHTALDQNNINLSESKNEKLILPNYLGLKLETKIIIKLFKELISFISYMKKNKNINKQILGYVIKSIVSGSTQKNLRLFFFLNSAFKKIEIRNLLYTFEGFAWERLVTKFANINGIVSIGYMHSAMFRDTIAIKNRLRAGYDPNYLVLAGDGIKEILISDNIFDINRIGLLGTARKLNNVEERGRDCVCLVIPEGIVEECDILLDYSNQCALIFPNIRFVWRLHPVIKEELLEKYNNLIAGKKNIIISEQDIFSDIEVSKWALYRGSTAIIAAASGGVIPIYLEKDEINIDPLYIVNKNKISQKNICGFLDYISNLSMDMAVKKYANKYYSELKIEAIENKMYDKKTIYI
jgi:hypothetical protein